MLVEQNLSFRWRQNDQDFQDSLGNMEDTVSKNNEQALEIVQVDNHKSNKQLNRIFFYCIQNFSLMHAHNRLLGIPSRYYQDLEQKLMANSFKKEIAKSLWLVF